MKILIMGYSGAGKSTLAEALGKRYGCPVLHLDTIQFQANWQEREPKEAEALAEAFLEEHESWVIDGSYMGRFSFARRCREADRIIQLLLPRRVCLYRAVKRYVQNRGRTRTSMAAGCEEKFDWAFLWWILRDGRTQDVQDKFRRVREQYGDKVVLCVTAKAAAEEFPGP